MYLYFFFNDSATTEIYTLSLHDALPICGGGDARAVRQGAHPGQQRRRRRRRALRELDRRRLGLAAGRQPARGGRSEEHTSELQSQSNLVCRLLLEKKNNYYSN